MQANTIRIAGMALGEHRHICAFYNSRDEAYREAESLRVAGRYLATGRV